MDELQITMNGELATVTPTVDIVASIVPKIRTELKAIISGGAKEVVVDLKKVEMIDSTGIGMFIAAHNSLLKTGGRIMAVNASADILDLFKAMRLDQHFSVSGA